MYQPRNFEVTPCKSNAIANSFNFLKYRVFAITWGICHHLLRIGEKVSERIALSNNKCSHCTRPLIYLKGFHLITLYNLKIFRETKWHVFYPSPLFCTNPSFTINSVYKKTPKIFFHIHWYTEN